MSEMDKLREFGKQFGVDFDEVTNELANSVEAKLAVKLNQAMEDVKTSVTQSLSELQAKQNSNGGGSSISSEQIRGMVEQEVSGMKGELIDALKPTVSQQDNGGGGHSGATGGFDWKSNLPAIIEAVKSFNQPSGGGLDNAIATLENNIAPILRLQQAIGAMQPPQPSPDAQFRANQNSWAMGFKEGAKARSAQVISASFKKGAEPPKSAKRAGDYARRVIGKDLRRQER